jgi:hypothetical protein
MAFINMLRVCKIREISDVTKYLLVDYYVAECTRA